MFFDHLLALLAANLSISPNLNSAVSKRPVASSASRSGSRTWLVPASAFQIAAATLK